MLFSYDLTNTQLKRIQIALIIVFVSMPLFVQLPFKLNLYLAWEGAYRLSLGQIPYRDFSLPMGFVFWIVPALFFKIFGPYLVTLVKAQVFLNLIGALSFRAILTRLGLEPVKVLLAILVYCISFVFKNFWPWYNNTVFIYELVAIYFLLVFIQTTSSRGYKISFILLCGTFCSLSFFTKQDGGALAVATVMTMLLYHSVATKSYKGLVMFIVSFGLISLLFYLPFLSYDINYWFNLGQAPHNSRVNIHDFLIDIFEDSHWIKFYLLGVIMVFLARYNQHQNLLKNEQEVLFALLTVCMLGQAMLIQVTSYVPANVNIYYHSFAVAYLLHLPFNFKMEKVGSLLVIVVCIMFWWSADYWQYSLRIIDRIYPGFNEKNQSYGEVSKYTYVTTDSVQQKKLKWISSPFRTYKGVLLPEETIAGINRIMDLPLLKQDGIQVLNMSELTPLAYEIGYVPLVKHPLWYHKNVALFDREIEQINQNIHELKYDLVLFHVMTNLNQFYPDDVRKKLKSTYQLIDTFQGPRDNDKVPNKIEVYIKPKPTG